MALKPGERKFLTWITGAAAGIAVLVVVVTGAFVAWGVSTGEFSRWRQNDLKRKMARDAEEGERDRREAKENGVRLVTKNSKWDDAARKAVFWEMLRGRDLRCDGVTSALMERPLRWRVTCDPGYRYVMEFNDF